MRLTTISPENQQRIAVVVPIVALVLSLFVVYPAWGRYGELNGKIGKQRAELNTLRNSPIPAPGPIKPTADYQPSEPPQFFGMISALAQQAGCRVVGYDIISSTDKTKAEGPIRALRAKVEIEAEYPQIRAFLTRLSEAPRLFVVTDLSIMRSTGSARASQGVPTGPLKAAIEIERYVAPPATAPAPPPRA